MSKAEFPPPQGFTMCLPDSYVEFVARFGGTTRGMYQAFLRGKMTPEEDYTFVMKFKVNEMVTAFSLVIAEPR